MAFQEHRPRDVPSISLLLCVFGVEKRRGGVGARAEQHVCVCVCVCVCARARARARVCVCVYRPAFVYVCAYRRVCGGGGGG